VSLLLVVEVAEADQILLRLVKLALVVVAAAAVQLLKS
jgi:hypothetical protein